MSLTLVRWVVDYIVVPQTTWNTVFFCLGNVGRSPFASCVGIVEVRGAELADNYGDILIRKVFLESAEDRESSSASKAAVYVSC